MRSIQRLLLLWLLAALTGVGLINFALSWRAAGHEVEEVHDAELAQYARLIDDLLQQSGLQLGEAAIMPAPVPWPGDSSQQSHRAHEGQEYERKLAVQIWSVDRRLLLRTASAPTTPLVAFEAGYQEIRRDGESWQVFCLRTSQHGRWIMVAERDDIRREVVSELSQAVVLPWLLSLPLLLALVAWLIRRALQPLRQLSGQLRQRDARALEPVVLDHTPAEIAPVTAALNTLLHDVAASLEREQRLSADAAHELRTPLTVLALHARNAIEAETDQQRQAALHQLEAGLQRCRRLLDQLLTWARVNSLPAHSQPERETIDLAARCRHAIAVVYPLLEQRQQDISLHEQQPVQINGHALLLETLLVNLIDNASRYSPAGSTLQLMVGTHAGRPCLEVHDNGPGIAPADRERVLRPFQRLNSGDAQGAGLGLAIASAIVSWHHGQLQLDQSPLGGLLVRVVFPGE